MDIIQAIMVGYPVQTLIITTAAFGCFLRAL